MKLDQAYKKVYMTHGLSVVGERGGNVIVWDVMDNKPLLLVNFDSKKVDPMFAIFDTIRISLERKQHPATSQKFIGLRSGMILQSCDYDDCAPI